MVRADNVLVPEAAVRPSGDGSDYHTGRGGAGNEHVAAKPEPEPEAKTVGATPVGLADKLKQKIFGAFKK